LYSITKSRYQGQSTAALWRFPDTVDRFRRELTSAWVLPGATALCRLLKIKDEVVELLSGA
jgi:hypothetical protein